MDDLTRQLDQLESKGRNPVGTGPLWFMSVPYLAGLLKAREEEVGSLRGEKAGLQREVDRLGRENQRLHDQVVGLQEELAKQTAAMEQAE